MKELGESSRRSVLRRPFWVKLGLSIAAGAVVVLPWLKRLGYPNLVGDDVQRVIDLQTLSLGQRMVRPFNEHLAPLFELFTALAWELAGRRLENAPVALTLASYVPFFLSLGVLWVLARREWGSACVATFAVVLFGASPIYAECVFWFSASTFTWALLFCLVALWLAGLARDRGSIGHGLGSAAACLMAPMGSAIGLLAGPAALIAAWPDRRPARPFGRETIALLPLFGTFLNLLGASLFRYHEVLASGVRTYGAIPDGLVRVVQAPLYLILTGYGRIENAHQLVPYGISAGFFVLGFIWLAFRVIRGEASERRFMLIGALLIGCGYTMIYCFRTALVGLDSLVTIQRYHLFPCLGFVLIVVSLLGPRIRRVEGRPVLGSALVLGLAAVLVVVNGPIMNGRLNFFRMQPKQRPVLAMMDHLAAIARAKEVSREQILHAFEPLEPRWTLAGWNALRMLPETAPKPAKSRSDSQIRSLVLDGLSEPERLLLFADMNATALLEPRASWPEVSKISAGQLVAAVRIHPSGRPDHYLADGWPSHLEFSFAPGEPTPRALALPGLPPGKTLELWWLEGDHSWSPDRRIIVRLERSLSSDWILPLDRIPNLPDNAFRRLRVTVRERGPVALGTPGLVR